MNESEMVNSLLDRVKGGVGEHSVELEKHYNHYGIRGSVDVVDVVSYANASLPDLDIYELKSESAVESVTGPNEVIRQFNKHKQYFFEGQEQYPPYRTYEDITFHLTFYASDANIAHLNEFLELYHNSTEPAHGTSRIELYHEDFGLVYVNEGAQSVADANAACEMIVEEVA